MRNLLKPLLKKAVQALGADIVSRETMQYWERQSLPGVLRQIPTLGVPINTVIDVGAAHGAWSVMCSAVLPQSRYVLLEPLVEYTEQLTHSIAQIAAAEFHHIALCQETGERVINVHPDLVGSSLYLEDEDSDVNGQPRTVRADTLDSMCKTLSLEAPYLLKLDVQGAELDVLAGGEAALQQCEFVIVESSFFEFYENKATIIDVVKTMNGGGFSLYDVFGLSHRPLDGALAQVDLCFVRSDGVFRRHHHFASAQDRKAVTARLKNMNAAIGPRLDT